MHTIESNIQEIVGHQLYRHKQPIFGGFLTISGNRCTFTGIGKQGDGYPEEEGCMSGCNSYSVDDAEMNAAIDEARRRLPELRRALEAEGRRGGPAIKGALVKARFQSPITGLTEHIWLDHVGFTDGKIVGIIANEPVNMPVLSKGESVSISAEDISDWMYRQDGQDVGGFTIRVMKRRGEQWSE